MPCIHTELQDKLTGALIGLARAAEGNESLVTESTDMVILEGLIATAAGSACDGEEIAALLERVTEEKRRLVPNCFSCTSACGRTSDYDMQDLWIAGNDVRSLKFLLLSGIREMAAPACRAALLGHTDKTVNAYFYKVLFTIGMDWKTEELLPVALEIDGIRQKCMALLTDADTK